MNASETHDRPSASGGGAGAPKTEPVEVTPSSITARVRESVSTGGDIARFSGSTVRAFPDVRHYFTEIFHQAGLLILSSGLVVWLMLFVMGGICGLEASYTLEQIGAPMYSGVFTTYCGTREMVPFMFGYIFAAKVGCGLVAEIGSMRISEEIDAMEVMGIKAKSYLVGTRILAAWIAMPLLFIVGLGMMYVAGYLVTVVQLGGVSSGGYLYTFWLYQNAYDVFASLSKAMAMGTAVVFVGCYYGYTSGGGPVGVGKNTAKSMMLSLVVIHIIGLAGTQLFWGLNPNAPIAN